MRPLNTILEVYIALWLFLPLAAQDRNVKVIDYPDQSERKTALVIGNGAYAGSPVDNPLNDACRDNPFRGFRGIERGLAFMNAPGGL